MRMAGSTSSSSTGPLSRAFRAAARRPIIFIETRRDGTFEDVTAKAGLIANRLGAGRVRRGLRQRRLRRSVRDVLGTEPPVPQSRQRHVRRRDGRRGAHGREHAGGARGVPFSITIATAAWTCLRPITSTSISPRRLSRSPACAATRAFPSRAGRRAFGAGRTCCTATRARARSRMSPIAPALPTPRAPTASASARWISTTTGGSISTSPTTRIQARCI